MAKLSNLTPGIAVVKERIKATCTVRVGINAMGLTCVGTNDDRLKSDVISALEPAKGLFIQNPRIICEVCEIDPSFSNIYRMEKRFCITDALYIDPAQIATVCSLPYTPAQRIMLTPKMILDIQSIMCGQSSVNICDYMKFSSNALSVSGTPVYGLTINKVFVKDRRCDYMTRVPDDEWSMSDTYKDIVWKSLVSIAYNYIQKNPGATEDDICKMYIKTYGTSWVSSLVVFNTKSIDIELPSYMTSIASSNITSAQLVNAYQLMLAILHGKFSGIHRMDKDDTVEYIKNMQKEITAKLEANAAAASESLYDDDDDEGEGEGDTTPQETHDDSDDIDDGEKDTDDGEKDSNDDEKDSDADEKDSEKKKSDKSDEKSEKSDEKSKKDEKDEKESEDKPKDKKE